LPFSFFFLPWSIARVCSASFTSKGPPSFLPSVWLNCPFASPHCSALAKPYGIAHVQEPDRPEVGYHNHSHLHARDYKRVAAWLVKPWAVAAGPLEQRTAVYAWMSLVEIQARQECRAAREANLCETKPRPAVQHSEVSIRHNIYPAQYRVADSASKEALGDVQKERSERGLGLGSQRQAGKGVLFKIKMKTV
jgi:hypothetical protein